MQMNIVIVLSSVQYLLAHGRKNSETCSSLATCLYTSAPNCCTFAEVSSVKLSYCMSHGKMWFSYLFISVSYKVLSNIVDAPWYIRNADLHRDLQMEMVTNEIGKFAKKHEERLLHHVNLEAIQLLDNSELVQRLKKNLLTWCSDH
jgi:hypothetical protein